MVDLCRAEQARLPLLSQPSRLLAQGGEQQARHTARLGPGVRQLHGDGRQSRLLRMAGIAGHRAVVRRGGGGAGRALVVAGIAARR